MKIKYIIATIIISIFSIQSAFADIISEISIRYSAILDRYELTLSSVEFQNFITKIDSRIEERLADSNVSDLKRSLYIALKTENGKRKSVVNTIPNTINNRTTLRNSVDSNQNSQVETNISALTKNKDSLFQNQQIIESTIRNSLEYELWQQRDNNILNAFAAENYVIYNTNAQYEFVSWNDIKKISFTRYIPVDATNYKAVLLRDKISKVWNEIVYDGQEYYIPSSWINIQTKNAYSRSQDLFLDSLNHLENYVKNGDTYYTYHYDSFLFFNDKYGFYDKDLTNSNISVGNSILLAEWGWMKIIKDFTKERLIASSLISRVSDQGWFLSVVAKDSKYTQNANNDLSFERLKAVTDSLTDGKSKDEKIEAIYNYVLDNHYYYEDFLDGNEDIFSGIDTFRNGYWVCDGYSKLMYYMLNFAWIKDIEHIRGYVIDAADFPEIGHAWVRIGNRYYDPTFDDPIGWVETLKRDQYRYFDLPKDIAYTNRLDGFNASDDLKNMSLVEREKLVERNLFDLLWKYDVSAYNLLQAFQVKDDLWFTPGETITVKKLENKLDFYEVSSDFSYIDNNGNKQFIRQLEFYRPTDENINSIIEVLGQDFTDSVLLKWQLENWSFEYRLAYVFETR